jgi:ABC-type nitrate/sulfonate/bicarbonate transport system ATPase subunit
MIDVAPPPERAARKIDDPVETTAQKRAERRYVEMFNLTKAYPNPYGEDVKVVDGFNLILKRGEVVSVIGHSGCGKSTVLTMVAALIRSRQAELCSTEKRLKGQVRTERSCFKLRACFPG